MSYGFLGAKKYPQWFKSAQTYLAKNRASLGSLPSYSSPAGFPRYFHGRGYPAYRARRSYQTAKRMPRFRRGYKRKPYTRFKRMPRSMRGYFRPGGFYGRYNKGRHQEVKFLDRTIPSLTPIPTAGAVLDIRPLLIPEDVTQNGRIGRTIWLKSFHLRMHLYITTTTSEAAHDIVRILIIHDKCANGANPAVTDILVTGSNVNSFLNLENQHRFRVLYNKIFSCNYQGIAGNGTANDTVAKGWNIQANLRMNIPITYDNSLNTGVIATIRSNNIVVMAISHAAIVNIGAEGLTRVRYTE